MKQADFPDDMTAGDRYWLTEAAQRAGMDVAALVTETAEMGESLEVLRHSARAGLVQHAHGLPYLLSSPRVRAAWDWIAWQEIVRRIPAMKRNAD